MENTIKGMREEDLHRHQNRGNQQREIKTGKTELELEAQLKTQEFKEMLKHLK